MKRKFIFTVTLASALAMAGCKSQVETSKPNLLFIFPDQYRLHALSLWSNPEYQSWLSTQGDPVHTPNIDRLAKEGVVFTQATSTYPVSSPHRAMLLSGMYPSQNGVYRNCTNNNDVELKHDIECFTDVLSKVGYQTAYVGKTHWHRNQNFFTKEGDYVGTDEAPGGHIINGYDTYIPEGKSRHSNEFWYQHIRDDHHRALAYSNKPDLVGGKKDGEQYKTTDFSTTREADVVISYLENKNNERKEGEPFSIIWSINPPHPGYNSIKDCNADVFNKYYKDKTPEELFVRKNVNLDEDSKQFDQRVMNAKVYFSLIKSVDDEIGRVLKALEKTGEMDNTIIVFTSDHGEMLNSHQLMSKNIYYDESFLVPFIIRYPSKLQHRKEDLLLGTVDIMPTMLGLMGLGDKTPSSVVGVDYSSELTSNEHTSSIKPKTALYLRGDIKGVRSDRYTLGINESGEYSIFDNQNDPYQLKELTFEDIPKDEAEMLKKELGNWLKKAKDEWSEQKLHDNLITY